MTITTRRNLADGGINLEIRADAGVCGDGQLACARPLAAARPAVEVAAPAGRRRERKRGLFGEVLGAGAGCAADCAACYRSGPFSGNGDGDLGVAGAVELGCLPSCGAVDGETLRAVTEHGWLELHSNGARAPRPAEGGEADLRGVGVHDRRLLA